MSLYVCIEGFYYPLDRYGPSVRLLTFNPVHWVNGKKKSTPLENFFVCDFFQVAISFITMKVPQISINLNRAEGSIVFSPVYTNFDEGFVYRGFLFHTLEFNFKNKDDNIHKSKYKTLTLEVKI